MIQTKPPAAAAPVRVAAADSSREDRAAADLRCTGTDDYLVIDVAIRRAAARAPELAEVELAPGNYDCVGTSQLGGGVHLIVRGTGGSTADTVLRVANPHYGYARGA